MRKELNLEMLMEDVKMLTEFGFTQEQAMSMAREKQGFEPLATSVAVAKQEVVEEEPVVVDPWDTVLCDTEVKVVWDDDKHTISFDGDLYRGFALWLGRANRYKVLASYKSAVNGKKGVKFEDGKEYYDAKNNFKKVAKLTVRIWKEAVEMKNEKLLKEVESNEEWVKTVLKKHGCE